MSKNETYVGVELPEGWKVEQWGSDGTCWTIVAGALGGVTIDWKKRGYRLGWSSLGPLSSTKKYAGTGWKQRLIRDAIDRLRGRNGRGLVGFETR
jgi:hypothetical protein